jgi:hypothetical protein
MTLDSVIVGLAWSLRRLTSFHDSRWVLTAPRQWMVVATAGELIREECTETLQGGEATALATLWVLD